MTQATAFTGIFSVRMLVVVLCLFLIVVCIAPVLFVVLNAAKTSDQYWTSKFALPSDFRHLSEKVAKLVEIGIMRQIRNTVVVATLGITLSFLFTSMAGFAFSKLRFPGSAVIFWSIIGLLAMPTQLLIVPLYVMFSRLYLENNLITLAVIYATFSFSFGTFLMRGFYLGIPNEIIDSAMLDGAGSLRVYISLMIPLGMPAIITLAVLNFFGFWNELFVSFIFNHTQESRLITSGIAMLQVSARDSGRLTDWTLIYAGIVVSLVIPFTVYFVFQRRLATGITLGAVKG